MLLVGRYHTDRQVFKAVPPLNDNDYGHRANNKNQAIQTTGQQNEQTKAKDKRDSKNRASLRRVTCPA
jgi:hypothetical protein